MSSTTIAPTRKIKILVTGLEVNADVPQYFRDLYGTSEEILAKIKADNQRIMDAGYDLTNYFMDDQDLKTGLDWLEAKLKEEKFDGFLIGSGLRLIPPQTALYEKVMNVARRTSPGSVFMCNDKPGGNFAAIQRNKEILGMNKEDR